MTPEAAEMKLNFLFGPLEILLEAMDLLSMCSFLFFVMYIFFKRFYAKISMLAYLIFCCKWKIFNFEVFIQVVILSNFKFQGKAKARVVIVPKMGYISARIWKRA